MGLTRLAVGSPSWGWLGGSFDPPHLGHLALGHAAKLALELDQLRFMPTGQSWQKQSEKLNSLQYRPNTAQRLAMLSSLLSTSDRSFFDIDDREIRRYEVSEQPTYTIDTVKELARDHPDKRRVMIIGADQLRNLPSWKHYDALLDYVHLAVTSRPGFGLQDLPQAVEQLVQQFGCDHLPWKSHGHIVFFSMSPVPISSTQLRRELATWTSLSEPRLGAHAEAQALKGFLGAPLLDYIRQHGLYRPILADSEQDPQRSH